MKDYVNVTRPTSYQLWWKRHSSQIQFAVFVLAIALIGSMGV